ncbi:MAG: DUF4124 domain-containing protein [Gammaproteobacteria bacterium]|uniref:DUF4124 domain-containing protein n=1 Tax=Marinobacter litoralis TaxID=187981 RepID=A0A3M2RB69_9GAMM|nr:DUF4124 domain-containing protein [Marinobacter litoralis]MBR9870008.1 DUF4124 domain-containing protein [Gammaproteobacteria bacterium]RMJ02552.1 hypothetical protein DOQ08_02015 [Marinobacter litoralis]
MQHRLTKAPVLAGLISLGLLTSAVVQAGMYRYTDANGQLVISNTIPQEATKRGYQIISDSGRVIETIAPAPTAEELAAREAEKERKQQQEAQLEQDRLLLKRFSHPDQAVRAMHRKVQELEGLIALKRGNISVLTSQLDNEQRRAAEMERAGRNVPDATLKKIYRLEGQVRDIEREIAAQRLEIDAVAKRFISDIERLEEITDSERTLPLTDSESASSE